MSLPRAALAAALGISRIMVYKLQQRGMPVDDADAARKWRDENLDIGQSTASALSKQTGANTGRPPVKKAASTASTTPRKAPAPGKTAKKSPETTPKQPDRAPPPAPAAAPSDFSTERTLRERAERELAQIRTAQAAGRVIDREKASKAVFGFIRAWRDRISTIPRRVAPDLVGVTEVREAELLVEDAYRVVFTEFEAQAPELIARMVA